MIQSFRLRLALLSALLSGIVLVAFGLSTWWLIRGIKLDRMDHDVRAQAERESQRTRDAAGWQRTEASVASEMGLRNPRHLALMVQDTSGQILYRSAGWPASLDVAQQQWPAQTASQPEPGPPPRPSGAVQGAIPPSPADEGESVLPAPRPVSRNLTLFADGRQWHIGLAVSMHSRMAVAVDSASIDAEMKSIFTAFLVALPLCLVLTGLGGWWISLRALRPVKKLTATARRINAEGLDQRIQSTREDREFGELIEVFNGMLERLERSFQQAYRFSADAAHELKTPLAILQGQLERAIHSVEDGSPMQAELSSILDEVRRLSTISRKLLLLAQADAGSLNPHTAPFPLSKALADLLEDASMLAPHLLVTGEIEPNITIAADANLLPQVFHNLISNAIKYNVKQGWIRIETKRTQDQVAVQISNTSYGISLLDQAKIFNRFFRADAAHSRKVEGTGLGLSVSREIVRAHGGDITFHLSEENVAFFSLVFSLDKSVPGPGRPDLQER